MSRASSSEYAELVSLRVGQDHESLTTGLDRHRRVRLPAIGVVRPRLPGRRPRGRDDNGFFRSLRPSTGCNHSAEQGETIRMAIGTASDGGSKAVPIRVPAWSANRRHRRVAGGGRRGLARPLLATVYLRVLVLVRRFVDRRRGGCGIGSPAACFASASESPIAAHSSRLRPSFSSGRSSLSSSLT